MSDPNPLPVDTNDTTEVYVEEGCEPIPEGQLILDGFEDLVNG